MDIGFSFSFPFNDTDWLKKILLVGLVGLIPIIGQLVVLGFMGQVIKRYLSDDAILLPDLDFGGQLSLGFKLFVVNLVYQIPAIIALLPAFIIMGIATSMAGSDNANTVITVGYVFLLCCGGLVVLYSILVAFMLPIAFARVVVDENIGAGFKFAEFFAILKANLVNYLIAILLAGFVGGIIISIGSMVCGIGVIFAIPYALAMEGNLFGQAYKIAQSKPTM